MSTGEFLKEEDLLKPEVMIQMYARGAFPMADYDGSINWYMPEIRTIIPLDNYNVPRSLKKFMATSSFEFLYDNNPMQIIKSCSERDNTWISDKLIAAYKKLLDLGYVHSVEVLSSGELVGGLYGISYRGCFYGESMFSHVQNASKAALVKLIERLNKRDYVLLDVQYLTPHLKMFGAVEISIDEFFSLLNKGYKVQTDFS
ncbi:MAG: leucyl/phenylalanyl-tRNA--protein transferase [bacterium]